MTGDWNKERRKPGALTMATAEIEANSRELLWLLRAVIPPGLFPFSWLDLNFSSCSKTGVLFISSREPQKMNKALFLAALCSWEHLPGTLGSAFCRCRVVQVDYTALASVMAHDFFSHLGLGATHVADLLERSLIPRKSKNLEFGFWFLCVPTQQQWRPPLPRHGPALSCCTM